MPTTHWTEAIAAFSMAQRAAGLSENTVTLRAYHLSRLAAAMRPKGPWGVTEDALVTWTGAQTWARETRRSHRSSFQRFYGWAHGRGYIDVDPSAGLAKVKPGQPRPRPTPEHALRLALAKADERVHLALRLGSELGLRRGEMVLVHERDLIEDLAGWTLVVHGKGGRERDMPLSDSLMVAIRVRCTAGGGWAFPGQIEGHLSAHYLGKLISQLLPEGVSTHTLRHRFATATHAIDRDLLTVQRLLGHASPDTTQRYVQVADEALRRTVLAIA